MTTVRALVLGLAVIAVTGCGPRVIVVTGTTIGIKATPGDGQTRPPQVVIGYKRAETAVIPVEGIGAENNATTKREAPSTVSSFYLENRLIHLDIRSFIGTGFAAQAIVESDAFSKKLAEHAK